MAMLPREEYVEQAYLFRVLCERLPDNMPLQDLLEHIRDEVLASTQLPLAIDFLLAELRHAGLLAPAMTRLAHYFAPFQAYLVTEAENDRSRFDMRVAFEVLRFEAGYRAESASAPGMFLFQFETLCRNRLRYDYGLAAMAEDPIYDAAFREWILTVRRQVGLIDLADLLYVRSHYFLTRNMPPGGETPEPEKPILFGEKEGKIAFANRRKDPLYLFAALQRHLGYPTVPRLKPADQTPEIIPQLMRRQERLEARIKLLEEEQRGGIDITRFYGQTRPPEPPVE